MKIRFTCSFFGCLHGHLRGFGEELFPRSPHRIIRPIDVGLSSSGEDWTLDYLLDLPPAVLARVARRAMEHAGGAETLDFFVGLGDPHSVETGKIDRCVASMNTAFAAHPPISWSFVVPQRGWLERLQCYHSLKSGQAAFSNESEEDSSAGIGRSELACIEMEPSGVSEFLTIHFHALDLPASAHTIEGFTARDSDKALVITSDPQIFAAWKSVWKSPAAGLLPEGWELHLARYWFLVTLALPHLARDGATAENGTVIPEIA